MFEVPLFIMVGKCFILHEVSICLELLSQLFHMLKFYGVLGFGLYLLFAVESNEISDHTLCFESILKKSSSFDH